MGAPAKNAEVSSPYFTNSEELIGALVWMPTSYHHCGNVALAKYGFEKEAERGADTLGDMEVPESFVFGKCCMPGGHSWSFGHGGAWGQPQVQIFISWGGEA